jgi:hypothetical protein
MVQVLALRLGALKSKSFDAKRGRDANPRGSVQRVAARRASKNKDLEIGA